MSDVAKSLGHHGHWGFSSGFDILELIEKASSCSDSNQSSEPINVLLIHPGDVRHIMITLARRNRHRTNTMSKQRPIHFYLFETCTEILARELVLLQIILDFEVPIRQRANVFLEVFGNLKVQKRTSRYIEELGQRLRDCMITGKGLLSSVLDFGLLKYRDKDDLETAFKGYDRSYPYDLDNYYDHRQRALYEDRYDNRRALFDWDYHGTIKSRASIVHIKQYKEWRQSGIAFEFGDQTYTEPNKTLMTFTEGFIKKGSDKGLKKEVIINNSVSIDFILT